jgi:FkbM family methyltransferase
MKRVKLSDDLEVFHANAGEAYSLHQEIFVDRCYEHPAVDLSPGDTVIDVGANIGMASLYFHRRFRNLKFICLEPIPSVSAILRANLEHHHVDATIVVAAASDRSGTGTLTCYPNNTMMSSLHADPAKDRETTRQYLRNSGISQANIDYLLRDRFTATALECDLVPLSGVLEQHRIARIDLLKIDVEKSEFQVLEGIGRADWPKIRRVCAEVHDIDGRLSAATAMFRGRGFEVDVRQNKLLERTELYDLIAYRI